MGRPRRLQVAFAAPIKFLVPEPVQQSDWKRQEDKVDHTPAQEQVHGRTVEDKRRDRLAVLQWFSAPKPAPFCESMPAPDKKSRHPQ